MSELNPAAVDAAIADGAARPGDTVSLPASEVLRLREIEKSHVGLERDTAGSFVERDLSTALEAANLVPGSSNQLLRLWKDDFVARRVDGRWIVEAKAGGSVAEVVKSRLESGEFSHFIPASSRGGSGAGDGASRTTPTQPASWEKSGLTQLQMIAANMKHVRVQGRGRGVGNHS